MRCGILIGSAMGGMKTFSAAIETLHVQARLSLWCRPGSLPSLVEREGFSLGLSARIGCQGHGRCSGCSAEGALLASHLI